MMTFLSTLSLTAEEISQITPILNLYLLGSIFLIGLATSIMVFVNARKMRGGVFGRVLTLFGSGMLVVFTGAILAGIADATGALQAYAQWADHVLFIVGFVLMATAAHKLSKAIKGE